jgi:DNA-binding CsgD family transcriptional regulator
VFHFRALPAKRLHSPAAGKVVQRTPPNHFYQIFRAKVPGNLSVASSSEPPSIVRLHPFGLSLENSGTKELQPSMALWNFASVEQRFAEAALDPTLWVTALETVTAATESFGTVLIPNSGGLLPNVPFTEQMGPSADTYFRAGWHLRDQRNNGIEILRQRGVVDDFDIMSVDRIKKHPYYQEFLAPHRLQWFAGVKVACAEDMWCLSIQRTIDQEPFTTEEKEQLATLSTRLSASVAMARAFGAAASTGLLDAFEISGTAAILINRQGKAFKVNQAGENLFAGDFQIVKGNLVSNSPRASAELNQSLHRLLWHGSGGGLSPPVSFPRAIGRPLLAYPIRPSSLAANALSECQAIVIIVDLNTVARPPIEALKYAFRLTEAEARLAARLAAGDSLQEITDSLAIAKETGRSQLKSIFAKIGVNRQAELVAVLSLLGPFHWCLTSPSPDASKHKA